MHITSLLVPAAQLANVLISNDDGWAEVNIRQLYSALNNTGFLSIISAPAINKSGTGSLDAEPTALDEGGCEFDSCEPFSHAIGYNASSPQFNYVNSYPVTSVKYGIKNLAPAMFGGLPDIVVAGVNVGCNLDIAVLGSGTVGATCEAAKQGMPALAFSGCSGSQIGWESTVPNYAKVYANLSAIITKELVDSGRPYLPPNIWLNVNYGESSVASCNSSSEYKVILSRITPAIPFVTPEDITICDNEGRLPSEREVVKTSGCFASISVGNAATKLTATAQEQAIVFDKLRHLLTCLPSRERKSDL